MSSEIKVDTISENTSANGVAIDSLGIKDGKITNLMNATLSAADLGTGLHIKSADSGLSSVAAGGDELIIEGSGDSGMHILSGASNDGNIFFGDSGDADNAYITYDHSTNHLHIGNGGLTKSNALLIFHGSDLTLGTNSETSPDTSRGGLCLNQGGTDSFIMTFKSSDIAHGMTDLGDTDTYAFFKKGNANYGGLELNCMTEEYDSLQLQGFATNEDTNKSNSAEANIIIRSRKKSGTAWGGHGSNGNLLSVCNHNDARFFFDAEGDFHADSSSTTFDAYEDAQLVRAYDLSHGKGVIDSKFDKFVSYNHEKLADLQLVGREKDGTPNHFINVTGMQRLHNGAIWQQYEKHQKLANAMYELAKAAVGEDKANEILEKNDIKLLN
jgi:hypothetical protein